MLPQIDFPFFFRLFFVIDAESAEVRLADDFFWGHWLSDEIGVENGVAVAAAFVLGEYIVYALAAV